jgi:hypothetical protein
MRVVSSEVKVQLKTENYALLQVKLVEIVCTYFQIESIRKVLE